MSKGTRRLLEVSMLRGVGPKALQRLSRQSGFASRPIEDLDVGLPGFRNAVAADGASEYAAAAAAEQIELAEQHRARIVSAMDDAYPALLRGTPDDPVVLFARGDLASIPPHAVAITGTDEPTEHGALIAERIARFFVTKRWSVVSGLADGCDAIAHRTALEGAGHTVAVLAHGMQAVEPECQRTLVEMIVEVGGVVLSQYPFGFSATPHQVERRDRTRAGLSRGVVMVQSDCDGSGLHAARASLRYGRWLAAPRPTGKDLANREAQIRANLILSGDDKAYRDRALEFDPGLADSAIIVLRGKQDYWRCLESSRTDAIVQLRAAS